VLGLGAYIGKAKGNGVAFPNDAANGIYECGTEFFIQPQKYIG